MKVNSYIGDQFFKTEFSGTKEECEEEKKRLDKERADYLKEYKKICKDKLHMDINFKIV